MANWRKLLVQTQTEDELYKVLHKMLESEELGNFLPESADILLGLLDENHEPRVWLLACVFVGRMCNLTSVATHDLARRGALSSLASVLNKSYFSLTYVSVSSEKGKLYELLIKFILSLLQHFSLGASVCINKILQRETFGAVLSAVDCGTSALYAFGSAETQMQLQSLIACQSLVGRRMWTPSTYANNVYSRLLGCDTADMLGADLPASDSFDVDLYDTNGDEDVHIIEQLTLSDIVSSDWESLCENVDSLHIDDGEWVDVYVPCVLDGAHFVAVFGAEAVKQFFEASKSLQAAVANSLATSLTQLPSRGQLVCVSHPELGCYRAYVVNADSSDKILTFAPDCGYVKEVPLSYLKTFDGCSTHLPSQPPVHVCKLMG